MLISGGKVLAIDKVKHGNTLKGDGAFSGLDVNTNVIATVSSVSSISSTLDKKIDTASANLSAEIDKKEDKITYHYNAFDKIDQINGSALAGGNNVVLEEGDNIKITPRQEGENVIYNISTSAYTSKDESLLKIDEYSLSAKNWLPEIKESSANAVDVVSANFGDTSNGITGYNGIGLNIPAQKEIVGGKSINVVTGANDFTINLDTSADVIAYSAGYGLDLANHKFSVQPGFFALSADVDDKIKELEEQLAKLGFYRCSGVEIKGNGEPDENELSSEGKLSQSKVYLVKVDTAPTPDQYKEWIWDGSVWTCIGDTTINLDGYATEDWVKNHFLSANALDLIASVSSQWNEVSSKLNTSDFNAWSEQADITPYTGIDPIKVEGHEISLTADYLSANALDEIKEASANWNSVYETVNATSSDWNEVSSKANKTDLDDLSGKVKTLSGELETTSAYLNEKIETLSGELESTSSFLSGAIDVVSAEFEKVVYTSATTNWDVIPYSAGKNINITNHTISSKDWTNEINAASANAVDVVKSNFDETPNNKFSGYDGTPFYVKQHTVTGTSPIIVKEEGDEYNITFEDEYKKFIEEVSAKLYTSALPTVESVTPDYLKVDLVENQDGTSAWKLSAAEQKNYKPGDYIEFDENDKINVTGLHNVTLSSTDESIGITATTGVNGDVNYNLSANIPAIPGISGINGLSGYYNSDTNDYIVGVNNSGMTYYRGIATSLSNDNKALFTNQIQSENITYNNGVFTIPSTVAKVTFSINEKIENNILTTNNVANHDFNLNKIALYCNDSEIISTQEYYHNELGVSELSLTYTIDNSKLGSNDYSIRYDGATLIGNFECNLSIIEEVLSFGTGGTVSATYHEKSNNLVHVDNTNFEIYADDLSGISPIYVQDKKNIGLNYDPNQFTVSGEGLHSTLQIKIETSGGTIDQEAFEKMANLINGRITETIPIGMVNSYETLGDGGTFSYLFRPTMEFDVNSATIARVMTHNASENNSQTQVVISELNESNAYIEIQWWSENKTLTSTVGTVTLTANQSCTQTRTLYPDRLYYATVINRGQQTQYIGFANSFLDDAGAYDIAYWSEHGANSFGANLPYSLNNVPANTLGQTGNAKLKPYIAFRNEG